jgi:hypothetical protein
MKYSNLWNCCSYKDSGVLRSALTAEEETRFQIAVYVYWQYSNTWRYSENEFHRSWGKQLLNESDDDEDDYDDTDSEESDDDYEDGSEEEDEAKSNDEGENADNQPASHSRERSKENTTMQKCNEFLDSLPYNILCWLREVMNFVLKEMDYVLQPETGPDEIEGIMSYLVEAENKIALDASEYSDTLSFLI